MRLAPLILVAALLLVSPMPFGSIRLEHRTLLLAGATIGLLLCLPQRHSYRRFRFVGRGAFALGAIGVLGLLQSLSWPRALVRLISPGHDRLAVLAEAPSHLSLAPSLSRTTALWWIALGGLLLAAAALGRNRRQRRVLAACLAISGLFEVLLGTQLWLRRSTQIWGTEVPGVATRLRGTFVNANHLALYLSILLALAFAWGWWSLRHVRRRGVAAPEARVLLLVPPVLLWLTVLAGLVMTASRAGLLAATAATATQGLLIAAERRRWSIAPAGLVVAAVGVAVVASLGLQQGLARLLATSLHDVAFDERLASYGASLRLWLQFPFVGTGLGTFREAFDLVRPEHVRSTWHHLHNDYLELLATTGVVGVLLLALGLWSMVKRLGRILHACRRGEDKAAALAALGALAAAAVHSVFDFGLAIPANAVALVVVCGACSAVALPVPTPSGVIELGRRDVRVLEPSSRRRRRRSREGDVPG